MASWSRLGKDSHDRAINGDEWALITQRHLVTKKQRGRAARSFFSHKAKDSHFEPQCKRKEKERGGKRKEKGKRKGKEKEEERKWLDLQLSFLVTDGEITE